MFINNFKNNILIYFNEFIITNFIKTVLIEKINNNNNNNNNNNFKNIVNKVVKKNNIKNKFFFSYLFKKIKFGYYVDKYYLYFIPNNLIDTKKNIFPKKILLFEILFKKIDIEDKFLSTRKFNFKKKKKINKIKINKKYLGIIKNVINYGIFIDIGQADGLLHITDIPNLKKIYNYFFIKNLILIKIIKFDKKLKKVSLNLKKIYKKNFEKNIVKKFIICIINKILNKKILCYNNISKKYILKNNINFKKNDKIKAYFIKNYENYNFLSLYYKIIKKNLNYIKLIIKYKTLNLYLLKYKKINIIYKKKLSIIKISEIFFYKLFLYNNINNEFNKLIFVKNNYYLKNNNFFLKIKKKFLLLNIKNIINYKNKIYLFIRKY
ncbi:S1 RNA-binding domain-containing protein [Candidatus Carsonella ruddii]|uniref:Putative ribosomal protein S1 n=1 Tax=Candidatus Carsonella ruddii HC isolate Thao2000 TaxID=1202538 RepID=J3TE79_CARRU|nr:S1 RNA-binding domain-containing protein [Candidatus Carsonella ruddii]AFP83912.1 putative ribosomal protein S1 [Candidatus Carsonella ruddii HC isolate Thao2000]